MEKEVNRLKKELDHLEKTHRSGIISKKEFLKGKKKVEEKLKAASDYISEEERKNAEIKKILEQPSKKAAKQNKYYTRIKEDTDYFGEQDALYAKERTVRSQDDDLEDDEVEDAAKENIAKSEEKNAVLKQVNKEKEKEAVKHKNAKKAVKVPIAVDLKNEKNEDYKYDKDVKKEDKKKPEEKIIEDRTDKKDKGDNIWSYLILLLVIVVVLFFIYKYTGAPIQSSGVQNDGLKVVTIYEFSDFYCPYSAAMQTTLKKIKEDYGIKVKIYQKQFPVTELHPLAKVAAEASECADDQNRFMEFHNHMFYAKKELVSTKEGIIELGKNIDLDDFERFKECVESHEKLQAVEEDITEGKGYGVKATPSLVIDGELLQGLQSYDVVAYTINQHLKK